MYHEDIIAARDLHPTDLAPIEQFNGPSHELQAGFEMPSNVWTRMFACYAIFFLAILSAVNGSGRALFAIAVSVLYAVMYFGLSKILASIGGVERQSPLDRGEGLQTFTGSMNRKSVVGQVLIVPVCIAGFAVSAAIISAVLIP
jgi:hypothetical protein